MLKQLVLRDSIALNTSPSHVWDVLTNPAQTKMYMFGCETVSDWKIDHPLLWNGNHNGKEMTYVKGNIVEIEHERFLAYTSFDPHAGVADIPENYLTVSYEIYVENGQTILTITQGDFATVENGEQRYQNALKEGGWAPILVEIQKLIDAQVGEKMQQ